MQNTLRGFRPLVVGRLAQRDTQRHGARLTTSKQARALLGVALLLLPAAARAVSGPPPTCADGPSCTRRCYSGDVTACVRLAELYRDGSGGKKQSFVRAASLYRKACDAGNAKGCRGQACEGGFADRCSKSATVQSGHPGTK